MRRPGSGAPHPCWREGGVRRASAGVRGCDRGFEHESRKQPRSGIIQHHADSALDRAVQPRHRPRLPDVQQAEQFEPGASRARRTAAARVRSTGRRIRPRRSRHDRRSPVPRTRRVRPPRMQKSRVRASPPRVAERPRCRPFPVPKVSAPDRSSTRSGCPIDGHRCTTSNLLRIAVAIMATIRAA